MLVLDDYHLIANERIQTAVSQFLDYLSPTVHLVISGRSDPPLPLARLRARGQLTEIRQAISAFPLRKPPICSTTSPRRRSPQHS
ncbi:MAG: hypothetical protein GY803_30875 [Chloroflexi bacterium]|nr:hypothetical protein [Chloroflexota bacterium]